MYFFLSNLSLADICSISTTVPKMLMNIQTHSRAISYVGCLTQMSTFTIFVCMDYMNLTAMAYDWKGAVASVVYTVVTPMLNPFIYSLRNRDIKGALRRLHSRTV
ncbi:Hypothetical predicted protein [Marmota monax]|uniref:G-protein coupled receptors family 1 profile domain-containing protein n=1 Tax=Marmota monax TaxID=9995 RepID=A0A5E4AVM1_MARMO|nr:Hypothetical predicted protein [Marmota monax]